MNSGSKLELSNIKYSSDGVNYVSLGSTKDITCEFEADKQLEPILDLKNEISFNFKISKKRKGTILERWLYYSHNKNKRIRKKYRLDKLLERG